MKKKSQKYIFLGYNANPKGYKLYDRNAGKKIIGQDVTFNEEGEWNWGAHGEDYNFSQYFEDDMKQPRMEQA